MNDTVRGRLEGSVLFAAVAAGSVSGFLYLSVFLALAFLVPVQFAVARSGIRAGSVAAGVSLLIIGTGQVWRLASFGAVDATGIAYAILPPAAFLAALGAITALGRRGVDTLFAALGVVAVLAVAAIPAFIGVEEDGSLDRLLAQSVEALVAPLRSARAEGFDASALVASLDVGEIAASVKRVLLSGYALFIFAMEYGSWWLGATLSGRRGSVQAPRLGDFRVPYSLVWPFLAAWAMVFAALAFSMRGWFPAFAWNLSLVFSLCYAIQGVGIAAHLLAKRRIPGILRFGFVVVLFGVLMNPVGGGIFAAVFALLGISEVWIPYRNPKGVGA